MAKTIIVPAKPGDIVLFTPGALAGGRVRWWRFEISFTRPDGSTGESKWLAAGREYAIQHGMDPQRFRVIGDVVWRKEFTSADGNIDSDAIRAHMEKAALNPIALKKRNPVEPVVSQQEIEPGRSFRGKTVKSWGVVNNAPMYVGNERVYLSVVRFTDKTKMYVRVSEKKNPLLGDILTIAALGGIVYLIYIGVKSLQTTTSSSSSTTTTTTPTTGQ
jgi:hypothetical protein